MLYVNDIHDSSFCVCHDLEQSTFLPEHDYVMFRSLISQIHLSVICL